ncbi:16S rRNA (cytidine(1402)-2'-O)-methyltransferase [Desulfobacterales bacterium HSG16]|nr:16S rRNA (cytidine(1402)-2'-O)-methyltransferase [Desulfobacterales bacterium HSG16]
MTEKKGVLYIVATPIGNMDDITLRAKKILESVDLIAAEDTRHTARLLSHFKITKRLISFHEHNEYKKTPELIEKMEQGLSAALVSDAGTPCISDPGYRLVKDAADSGISVVPIPGVSAAITALSVSGLPTDRFTFVGFPPRKAGRRKAMIKELSTESKTIIFYESPRRIISLLSDILDIMGDRQGVLAREMTKIYEEFIREPVSEIIKSLETRQSIKGECVLLLKGAEKKEPALDSMEQIISDAMDKSDKKLSALAKEIAGEHGFLRKNVYDLALKIKAQQKKNDRYN